VSPELLLNDDRFEVLWGKKYFIVLDEAHVIKEWGGTFRTDYLKLGPIHQGIGRGPVWLDRFDQRLALRNQ
jgi:superfamily II DNA helicase RecQ